MSVLSPIACYMGRHEPLRRKVQWDGRNYIGHCRHCGKEIERVSHRNWREREEEPADTQNLAIEGSNPDRLQR